MEVRPIARAAETVSPDPFAWMGQVLSHFAAAEQAIGNLSVMLGLPITNGSLSQLEALRRKLKASENRKCRLLDARIGRWSNNRPIRHLLAHATITLLYDADGEEVVVTRHLPRDAQDVSADRMWSAAERTELLRQVASDGRSICDHIRGLRSNVALTNQLRSL